MTTVPNRVGIVAIGRNEGLRLVASLESINRSSMPVVYVDSGSTDQSVENAEELGCEVVRLDLAIPFTAARARNEGCARLLALNPNLEFVQFIDGDCELDREWLPIALSRMDSDSRLAAVCGRRREKFADASFYNRLVDVEWDTPVGEALACGGDALIRLSAFSEVHGYDESFAAGEEPEMCYRMRQRDWKVWRLNAEMTRHDAALTHFAQWWARNKRSGSAYAQGAWTHGRSAERYNLKDCARIWLWGAAVPLGAVGFAPATSGLSLAGGLAAYGLLIGKMTRYRMGEGDSKKDALIFAASNLLGKFPQLQGQFRFFRHKRSSLIEYKGSAAQAGKPKVAYVLQYFPKMSETFVYREVKALREKGYEVQTYSNRTPERSSLPTEAQGLMASTTYAVPVHIPGYLLAGTYWLLRRPLRTIGCFAHLLAQKGESGSNRRRTMMHFAGALALAHKAKGEGIQHIHAHFAVNAATIAFVMSRLLGLPFSFTVHQVFMTDQIVLKTKLRAAKFIVSISNYSTNWLLDYAPEIENLSSKFHIVHCGISPDQFRPTQTKGHEERGGDPLIFSVARWDEKKGIPYLVEACRILRDRGVPYQCIIAGEGDTGPEVQELIERYDLSSKIRLPGYVLQDSLQEYLDSASIFALPCITAADGDVDGIPVALMEPMAKELPVVSTRVSGIPELITNDETGLLVPEKDARALADALQRLIENPAFAKQLGRAARQKVINDFNIDSSAAQLVTLITEHLDSTHSN